MCGVSEGWCVLTTSHLSQYQKQSCPTSCGKLCVHVPCSGAKLLTTQAQTQQQQEQPAIIICTVRDSQHRCTSQTVQTCMLHVTA